ncbi:hypothetical protein ACOSQ3_031593 [Xanthoceras sorbifolium]
MLSGASRKQQPQQVDGRSEEATGRSKRLPATITTAEKQCDEEANNSCCDFRRRKFLRTRTVRSRSLEFYILLLCSLELEGERSLLSLQVVAHLLEIYVDMN